MSALVVSFMATTVLVAGKAIPMTINKGITVQMISTVVLSWNEAGLCPSDFLCLTMEYNITPKTTTKITRQMIIMNQCNQWISSMILVTGAAKFNCLTAGPPGISV